MKRSPLTVLLLLSLSAPMASLSVPMAVSAQGLTVGARAGTLGLGAEAALGLSDKVTVRGGFGVFPLEYEGEFDGQDYTVGFPTSIWSAGVDLYLGGGPIRFMGGVMGRSGDLDVETSWTDGRTIGDETYEGSGSLEGTLEQSAVAPFAGIGFGKHTSGGFGFFLDMGVAFTGDPEVSLVPGGEIASAPGIQEEIEREEANIEEDAGGYLKYWPMISIGFKIPLSGGG